MAKKKKELNTLQLKAAIAKAHSKIRNRYENLYYTLQEEKLKLARLKTDAILNEHNEQVLNAALIKLVDLKDDLVALWKEKIAENNDFDVDKKLKELRG